MKLIRHEMVDLAIASYLKREEPCNLILMGKRHMGKYATALELAEYLLCDSPVDGRSCGHCRSCRKKLFHHEDFVQVGRSKEQTTISVEQIRELKEKMDYRIINSGRKVCIIDDADAMSAAAQNSLLKLLEDENHRCVFLLVAHKRLLSTIESRCVQILFHTMELKKDAGIEDLLSGGKQGAKILYHASGFSDYIRDLTAKLAAMKCRRDILLDLNMVKEGEKNSFYEKWEKETVEDFLCFLETVFFEVCLSACKRQRFNVLAPVTENLKGLYSVEEAVEIVQKIEVHRLKLAGGIYNKNDFFALCAEIGGNRDVIQ